MAALGPDIVCTRGGSRNDNWCGLLWRLLTLGIHNLKKENLIKGFVSLLSNQKHVPWLPLAEKGNVKANTDVGTFSFPTQSFLLAREKWGMTSSEASVSLAGIPNFQIQNSVREKVIDI